ncbi:MAG: hypothetical protein ACREQ8_14255, partial [Woeseiaceae bacterium]
MQQQIATPGAVSFDSFQTFSSACRALAATSRLKRAALRLYSDIANDFPASDLQQSSAHLAHLADTRRMTKTRIVAYSRLAAFFIL